jgi:hypothetical protein
LVVAKIKSEDKIPLAILGVIAGGCFLFILGESFKKTATVNLTEGWNLVAYPGREMVAPEAFASIEGYLIIAYHLLPGAEWEQVTDTSVMVPNDFYDINVSADCVWQI